MSKTGARVDGAVGNVPLTGGTSAGGAAGNVNTGFGVTTIGADADEGVPYEGPPSEPLDHGVPRHCLTS